MVHKQRRYDTLYSSFKRLYFHHSVIESLNLLRLANSYLIIAPTIQILHHCTTPDIHLQLTFNTNLQHSTNLQLTFNTPQSPPLPMKRPPRTVGHFVVVSHNNIFCVFVVCISVVITDRQPLHLSWLNTVTKISWCANPSSWVNSQQGYFIKFKLWYYYYTIAAVSLYLIIIWYYTLAGVLPTLLSLVAEGGVAMRAFSPSGENEKNI